MLGLLKLGQAAQHKGPWHWAAQHSFKLASMQGHSEPHQGPIHNAKLPDSFQFAGAQEV